jgi:hypothetical protein
MRGFITPVMKGFITLELICPSGYAQQPRNGDEKDISPAHCLHHLGDEPPFATSSCDLDGPADVQRVERWSAADELGRRGDLPPTSLVGS